MEEQIPSLQLGFALWHSLILIYCFWSFGAGFSGEEKGLVELWVVSWGLDQCCAM
jgi:hypothetical protein